MMSVLFVTPGESNKNSRFWFSKPDAISIEIGKMASSNSVEIMNTAVLRSCVV